MTSNEINLILDGDFPFPHFDPPELNDLGLPTPEVPADWELQI